MNRQPSAEIGPCVSLHFAVQVTIPRSTNRNPVAYVYKPFMAWLLQESKQPKFRNREKHSEYSSSKRVIKMGSFVLTITTSFVATLLFAIIMGIPELAGASHTRVYNFEVCVFLKSFFLFLFKKVCICLNQCFYCYY